MTPATAFVYKLIEGTDIGSVVPLPDDISIEQCLNWMEKRLTESVDDPSDDDLDDLSHYLDDDPIENHRVAAHAYHASLQPPPPGASAGNLEQWVNSINWNTLIADDEGDGCYFVVSNLRGIECTGYADTLARIFGKRAQTFGFYKDINPTSKIAQEAGGHDFAVVDGQYIVDPWLSAVANISDRAVFDLKSEADAEIIAELYGDQARWGEPTGLGESVDDTDNIDLDDLSHYLDELTPILKASEPVRPYTYPTCDTAEYRELLDTRTGIKVGTVRFYNGDWTWHGLAWDSTWWQRKVYDQELQPLFHKKYHTLDDLIQDASYAFRRLGESVDDTDDIDLDHYIDQLSSTKEMLAKHGLRVSDSEPGKEYASGHFELARPVQFQHYRSQDMDCVSASVSVFAFHATPYATVTIRLRPARLTQYTQYSGHIEQISKQELKLRYWSLPIVEYAKYADQMLQDVEAVCADPAPTWPEMVKQFKAAFAKYRPFKSLVQRKKKPVAEAANIDDPDDLNDPDDLEWLLRRYNTTEQVSNLRFGFSVHTTDGDMISINAQERGIELTDEVWDRINYDLRRLEMRAVAALNANGIDARDEGHDSSGDLRGSATIKAQHTRNCFELNTVGCEIIQHWINTGDPIDTGRGNWDSYLGEGSQATLYKDLFAETAQLVDVSIDFHDMDQVTAYFNSLDESQEDPDDISVEHYIDDILNLGDFKEDATNFGFGFNRIDVWGRYAILTGATYWSVVSGATTGEEQPVTEPMVRDLMDKFLKKYNITEHRLSVSPGPNDASGHPNYFWVQLAVPKYYFTPDSVTEPAGRTRDSLDDNPNWGRASFPFIADEVEPGGPLPEPDDERDLEGEVYRRHAEYGPNESLSSYVSKPPPPPWLRNDKGKNKLFGPGFGGPYESQENPDNPDNDDLERYIDDLTLPQVVYTREQMELTKRGFVHNNDGKNYTDNWKRDQPNDLWVVKRVVLTPTELGWLGHHYTPDDARVYRGSSDELLTKIDDPLTESEDPDDPETFLDWNWQGALRDFGFSSSPNKFWNFKPIEGTLGDAELWVFAMGKNKISPANLDFECGYYEDGKKYTVPQVIVPTRWLNIVLGRLSVLWPTLAGRTAKDAASRVMEEIAVACHDVNTASAKSPENTGGPP